MSWFFFLIIVICAEQSFSTTCNDLLTELAKAQQQFVYCNTLHALPLNDVRLCNGCKTLSNNMEYHYKSLIEFENCSKIFTETDRMNIMGTTQSMLTGLWNRAYCEDCFKGNNWVNFNKTYRNLADCLQFHKETQCTSCLNEYMDMNNFYKSLEKKNNGKVCFDMQDIMNKTRVKWSEELKCCKREINMTTFLLNAFAFAVLPLILLYSGAIILTKRREANHGLLNDEEPDLDVPSTSTVITAALATHVEPTRKQI